MSRKKQADALKAKQRKQKIFVAIGGVALLAAAAFEVPMLMKGSGGSSEPATPPPAAVASPPADGGTTSLAPPTPGTNTAAPAAGVGQLVDTDVPPQPSQDRLVAFTLFPSKDPFVPQVTAAGAAGTSGTSSTSAASGASSSKAGGSSSDGDGSHADVPADAASRGEASGAVVPPTSTGSSGTTDTVQTVTISVNGKSEAVGRGGTFPASSPTFRLVSIGKGTAEIGIVGGSYATGGETVTLRRGVPLTLVNTSDETRYRIVLLKSP